MSILSKIYIGKCMAPLRTYLAEEESEDPLSRQLVGQPGEHDGEPEEKVGRGQRRDEDVRGTLEAGVRADGEDDEPIAKDGAQGYHAQEEVLEMDGKENLFDQDRDGLC